MSKLYFGGVPTRMDVAALMEKVKPVAGQSVPYADIAAIIDCRHESNRFRTVTGAWRKKLLSEKSIQVKAEGGAFHFLTATEALGANIEGLSRVGKQARRVVVRSNFINAADLSETDKEKHRILVREAAALVEATRRSVTQIEPPKPKAALRVIAQTG